ncbi:unnamed protein product [Nippostrongylus brasiliensis]|uniref:Uncharacterized protein n=1 Tax=Nippostrongylus brasiliensis TaxID=27835 RepID=A0A0N4XGU7_NIPBR|nr:unnamed protein product [Nippostrongylus brasiliensis]
MDNLSTEADELVQSFQNSGYRYTSKIRTRLVLLLLQLIPAESEIKRQENPELQQKLDDIVYLLETKMRVKYDRLKQRFFGPTLLPFAMMQAPTQNELQNAILRYGTTPTTITFLPASNRITDTAAEQQQQVQQRQQFLPSSTANRQPIVYPPQFSSAQRPPYQPTQSQFSFPSIGPPQDYGPSQQFYWPLSYQRLGYGPYQDMRVQQPSTSSQQWYWPQSVPLQRYQRQSYYWPYRTRRAYQ